MLHINQYNMGVHLVAIITPHRAFEAPPRVAGASESNGSMPQAAWYLTPQQSIQDKNLSHGIIKDDNARIIRRHKSTLMRERIVRQTLRRQGQIVAPAIRVPSPRLRKGVVEIAFVSGDPVFRAMVAKTDAATILRSSIAKRHKAHLRLLEFHKASLLLGGYNTPCLMEDQERALHSVLRQKVAGAVVIQAGVRGRQTRQQREVLAAKEAQRQAEIETERQRLITVPTLTPNPVITVAAHTVFVTAGERIQPKDSGDSRQLRVRIRGSRTPGDEERAAASDLEKDPRKDYRQDKETTAAGGHGAAATIASALHREWSQ